MAKLAPNPDPIIGILPHKYIAGMDAPADQRPAMEFYRLSDAMTYLWPSDNHFVTYSLVDTDGQPMPHPRLNKPIVNYVREAGCEIFATCFAFDFDNPDHLPWAPGQFERWVAYFEHVGQQWPMALQFQWLYTTRNGARAVYVLNEPLPVEIAEGKHRGMVQMFNSFGLNTDPLSDWTRLFRLPKVHRDKVATTTEQYHYVMGNPGVVIDQGQLIETGSSKSEAYDTLQPVNDPKPEIEEAKELLEAINPETGYRRKTEWYKSAKQRLKNRDCFPCLFEHQQMAVRGNRNNTIHSYVGQATSLLINIPNTTPQHVYALFLDPVLQFDPEPDTPDWTNVLWDHVCRLWSKEDAKLRAKLKEIEPDQERLMTLAEQMVEGMRYWCNHPYIHGEDPNLAVGFVLRHAIVSVGRYLYLIQPNGHYSANPLNKEQLIAEILCRNMQDMIPVRRLGQSNNVVKVPAQEIQDQFSVSADAKIEYQPNIVGGYLKNLGSPGKHPVLVLPCYRLNPDLTPRFDPEVDQWLRVMFGREYDVFERWAKWALAYDENNIAALSIVGAPGAGKKLIVQGLAECLERPYVGNAEDIVGKHQYGLLWSPFINVDEGWPEGSAQHASDAFRRIITDPITVEEKYKPPAVVVTYPRIIMTANNLNVIKTLTGKRAMSLSDREALSQRLLHFNVGDRSSAWLRDHGGMGHTARPGRRWIAGARGQSDFILARHFLYLYSMRGSVPATRFLVEGNSKHEVLFSMQTETGSTPIVIECIIRMLNSTQQMEGMVIDGNRLYVLASQIVDFFRLNLATTTKERVTANIVAAALKSLTLTEDFHTRARTVTGRPTLRRHWHDLDCRLLQKVAERVGHESTKLDILADGQTKEFGPLDPDSTYDDYLATSRVYS